MKSLIIFTFFIAFTLNNVFSQKSLFKQHWRICKTVNKETFNIDSLLALDSIILSNKKCDCETNNFIQYNFSKRNLSSISIMINYFCEEIEMPDVIITHPSFSFKLIKKKSYYIFEKIGTNKKYYYHINFDDRNNLILQKKQNL